jgi:ABC-type phosphate transport system permease subunit
VERHVTLLGTLEYLWGALAMLVGVSMLLQAGGAAAELLDPVGSTVELAAGLTAVVFGLIGVFALLWGGAHVWAAALLTRRRPFGRMLSLALAVVDLLVLPFGTALGAYAMWVLLTNEGRRLFEPGGIPGTP